MVATTGRLLGAPKDESKEKLPEVRDESHGFSNETLLVREPMLRGDEDELPTRWFQEEPTESHSTVQMPRIR